MAVLTERRRKLHRAYLLHVISDDNAQAPSVRRASDDGTVMKTRAPHDARGEQLLEHAHLSFFGGDSR
ncbi:hypothetical protein [Myxococcus sp. Y35]|uniref:hypothetical protein n=1 Tax=Pseudomyxococcus flavus TaxID=3115648 RepID=UPI003CFA9AEB